VPRKLEHTLSTGDSRCVVLIRMVQEQGRIAILSNIMDTPPEVITELVAENECSALGTPKASSRVTVVSEVDDDGFYDTYVTLDSNDG
jgi:hypothetical protein